VISKPRPQQLSLLASWANFPQLTVLTFSVV